MPVKTELTDKQWDVLVEFKYDYKTALLALEYKLGIRPVESGTIMSFFSKLIATLYLTERAGVCHICERPANNLCVIGTLLVHYDCLYKILITISAKAHLALQ